MSDPQPEETEIFVSEKRRAAFLRFVQREQSEAQARVNEELEAIREDYNVPKGWVFDVEKGRWFPIPILQPKKEKTA